MYNMPVELVPVVLGYTGVASSQCYTHLCNIPGFTDILFSSLQKAVIFGIIYVLHAINL